MTWSVWVSTAVALGLTAVLAVVLIRRPHEIRMAKAATFGWCVSEIIEILAADADATLVRAGQVLSLPSGKIDAEATTDLLRIATLMRMHRSEPAVYDVGGEHTKALVRGAARETPTTEGLMLAAASFIDTGDGATFSSALKVQSQADLCLTQIVVEKRIVDFYEAHLAAGEKAEGSGA